MPLPSVPPITNLGFQFGLENSGSCFPRKFRWLFTIDGVSAVANALPPLKGARPNFGFKEQEIHHLVETIYYPVRPEWKPITLTLYDISNCDNPVFTWLRSAYEPQNATWIPVADAVDLLGNPFMRDATLTMYDGCGNALQQMVYEDAWPKEVNWGEVDMGDSNITTVDVTLRYSRAYFVCQEVYGYNGMNGT